MSKQVVLTEKQYCDLKRRSDFYGSLMASGVENWSGYVSAVKIQEKTGGNLREEYTRQMNMMMAPRVEEAIDNQVSEFVDSMVTIGARDPSHQQSGRRLDSKGKTIRLGMVVSCNYGSGVAHRFSGPYHVVIKPVDSSEFVWQTSSCTIIGEHK